MASVKEMRTRIGSVKSTQKITKALQMVAAAKLRRAQVAAEAARPYARGMATVIANLAAGVSGHSDRMAAPRLLAGTGSDKRHLIIVATSDRGLAGGFNGGIIRAARERIATLLAEGKDVKIITIGRKGRDGLRRLYGNRFVESYEIGTKAPGFSLVKPIAARVLEAYANGEFDVVSLIHSSFKSVVTQTPRIQQLIPAQVEKDISGEAAPFYDYEPDEDTILEALLPQNISVQLLAAMLDNQAGFFASQMTAMDNATRNAGDLINALTIQMNRTRQAQITKELIEIISGASAV
jgi:F-type H+-transporting ATPase subunit gamma